MKKILSKYKIMTVAALGCAAVSNAEIIYTDVDPDETYNDADDSYELDLNNDGSADFTIVNSSFSYSFYYGFVQVNGNNVNMEPGSGNSMMGIATISSTYSGGTNTNVTFSPIRANDAISSGQSFISNNSALLGFNEGNVFGNPFEYKVGNFNDTIFDRFAGLKFKSGSETYFGWVRLSVKVESGIQEFKIFDYAYEDSGEPIVAGAGIVSPGSLSLNEDLAIKGLKVRSQNGQIYISSDFALSGNVNLLNISGAIVQTKSINGRELVLNAENITSGTYLVQVINEDGRQSTKKIIL